MTPKSWSDEQFLRMTHRYAHNQGYAHAWPDYENAAKNQGRVWGVFLFGHDNSPHVNIHDVRAPDLNIHSLTPVADAWRAIHRYALGKGYATGIPTFEASHTPDGVTVFGVLHVAATAGFVYQDIPYGQLDFQPDMGTPGRVIQAVNRWANRNGYYAGLPVFEQAIKSNGRVFGANLIPQSSAAGILFRDVLEQDLTGETPPPAPSTADIALQYTENDGDGHVRVWVSYAVSGRADRPITSLSYSCPSTWRVAGATVTHSGHSQAGNLLPNQETHAFDGQLAAGEWVISVTGASLNIEQQMSIHAMVGN